MMDTSIANSDLLTVPALVTLSVASRLDLSSGLRKTAIFPLFMRAREAPLNH